MTTMHVETLRAEMTGAVVRPGDSDYEELRKVWNGDIDRRPAVIARCASARDVSAAVRYAQAEGLEIAVRGGSHSISGQSTVDDGLIVDLSGLRTVTVDPATRRVTAGGGALLSDLDAAAAEHGLVVPSGIVGHTGVGGITLGGGMGWRTREFGLSSDNLVSAEVVLADGRIARASAEEEPDLFWALRGGGGNFGVVTEMEFRGHEADPMIRFALLFWGLDQGAEVLRLAESLTARLPRHVTPMPGAVNAPPAPFVPEEHRMQPGYVLMLAGFGAPEDHEAAVAEVRASLPPLFEFVTPMPYTALQQMFDDGNAAGFYYYEHGGAYLDALDEPAIAVITEHASRRTSPLSIALFYRLDEAYLETADDDTAFSGARTPCWQAFIIAAAPEPEMLPADRAWARDFTDALRPVQMSSTYVNTLAPQGVDRVRASYGAAKYERLARIKGEYDPGNAFHRNVNIKPA